MNSDSRGLPKVLTSLSEAIEYVRHTLSTHPERDQDAAWAAALAGKRRPHVALTMNHLVDPADTFVPTGELELPEVKIADERQAGLAREIVAMTAPLKMLNPISLLFGTGKGPGTLITCFGVPLNPDAQDAPAHTKTIDEVLAAGVPDPRKTGLTVSIRERIGMIKDLTPDSFKIGLPDAQGPFNLAHSLVGEESMIGPYTDPDRFRRLLDVITDFWIETVGLLKEWIGPERAWIGERHVRISECSCNLVSRAFYEEFILPHDLRIAEAFGPLHIHPCSGPHVFRETLENIPGVVETEAGFIAKTAAGSISVSEALEAVKGGSLLLSVGQELPEGEEYETVRADLDHLAAYPRMTLAYTGMHWRKKDRPLIREIHGRLDEYWRSKTKFTRT